MFCYHCGKEIKDGASFCVYCGKPLTARKVNNQAAPAKPGTLAKEGKPGAKKDSKRAVKDAKKANKKAKRAARPLGRKIGSFFLTLIIWLLVLAILAAGAAGALVYFDIVDIPVVSSIMAEFGMETDRERSEEPDRESPDEEEPLQDPDETTPEEEETVPPTEDPADVAYRDAEAQCGELAAGGDFEAAVQYLEECAALYEDDPRYATLLTEYQQLLKDHILTTAADYAAAGQYRLAIQTASDAWNQYADPDYYEATVTYRRDFGNYNTSVFSAGKYNTILLRSDGTAEICGDDTYGELSANYWTNLTSVSAGDRHVVGLKADGTVVAAGERRYGQCDVDSWTNIVAISAGDVHTVGLTGTGSVVSTGYNYFGQCNVSSLMAVADGQRIVSVAAGYVHTLALLESGKVAACGDNSNGACNVSGWTDIVAIYAGTEFSAGLKSDGTVVATGLGTSGWDLSGWTDIVNLSAGDYYLVGLKADGTVLSVSAKASKNPSKGQTDVSEWTGITFIAAGNDHTVALNASGEILGIGSNKYGQCTYSGTKLYG